MKTFNLKDMVKGWFIGNFKPTCHKANFEVGVKRYKEGDYESLHYHKFAKEFTVIVSGVVEMNGYRFYEDDIIQVDENYSTDFKCLTDVVTVVVKTKSVKGDKYGFDIT